ncbi:hypothetical protein AB6A40_001099 [Gnathostoma spinigerum]|uniref:MICOS complex subunit MIC19 n=1 Tax=Gnathostoma spinigerum TaxID=75299 RepID=A0ABD6E3F6_9BILA
MGTTQSQNTSSQAEEQDKPDVVRIDRSDIPDEYKTVGVSENVVNRIIGQSWKEDPKDVELLKSQLSQAREQNERLRRELTESQKRIEDEAQGNTSTCLDDIQERKRALEETMDRVQERFFSYQRENECLNHEQDIMNCISKNSSRLLDCSQLVLDYQQCVSNFRNRVLEEVNKA